MPNPLSIDRPLMQHLAELARLHIPAERQNELRDRLARVVTAFSALQDADLAPVAAVAPLATDAPLGAAPAAGDPPIPAGAPITAGPRLALRADQVEPPLPVATVLANAPQQAGSAFVVPRVIDA